jgi:hypothetical protein
MATGGNAPVGQPYPRSEVSFSSVREMLTVASYFSTVKKKKSPGISHSGF